MSNIPSKPNPNQHLRKQEVSSTSTIGKMGFQRVPASTQESPIPPQPKAKGEREGLQQIAELEKPVNTRSILSSEASTRDKREVVLTLEDLPHPCSERILFAQKNNFKIKISLPGLGKYDAFSRLADLDSLKIFISFTENAANQSILPLIEEIELPGLLSSHFGALELSSMLTLETFNYDKLSDALSKCSNVTSFSCNSIKGVLTVPAMPNLTSLNCKHIYTMNGPLTITGLPKLVSISLDQLDCGLDKHGLILEDLPQLEQLTLKHLGMKLTFKGEFPSLKVVSCGALYGEGIIFPKQLNSAKSLSFGSITAPITFPEELNTLEELSCDRFMSMEARMITQITLPPLPNLKRINYDKSFNPPMIIQKISEELQTSN